MKKVTTAIIALFTISNAALAGNANPAPAAGLKATAASNAVVLNFTSAAASIEIERSFYSNSFTSIATVNIPLTGTVNNFRINDTAAALSGRAVACYRIKQTNADGTVTYSNTSVVTLHNNNAAVKTAAMVSFTAAQNGHAVITVKSLTGKTAATINSLAEKGGNTVAISNELAKGMYQVEIAVNGVLSSTQKIIVE